ncbi:hypothetical protein [Maioricimonas rarisocia]|nr:hypothetical protein [Maioricimonas rarisocia]
MDRAFVECHDLPFDQLQTRLGTEADALVQLAHDDPAARLEIDRCRYERLLMGAIHRKRPPDECLGLFEFLEHLTFANIHRKWLVLQNLLVYLLDDGTHYARELAESLALSMHKESIGSLQQLMFVFEQNYQLMRRNQVKP